MVAMAGDWHRLRLLEQMSKRSSIEIVQSRWSSMHGCRDCFNHHQLDVLLMRDYERDRQTAGWSTTFGT